MTRSKVIGDTGAGSAPGAAAFTAGASPLYDVDFAFNAERPANMGRAFIDTKGA